MPRIASHHDKRPANITPEHWEEATGWAVTAFCNLPMGNESDRDPLERFRTELDEKMAGGDSLATLRHLRELIALKNLFLPSDLAAGGELQRLHQAIPDSWIYRGRCFHRPFKNR